MYERVSTSILRDPDRRVDEPPHAVLQAGRAWPTSPLIEWKLAPILRTLEPLVRVSNVMEGVAPIEYGAEGGPNPFAASDEKPLRVEVELSAWTIDDAAWLTEVMSIACKRARIQHEVQIGVRLT